MVWFWFGRFVLFWFCFFLLLLAVSLTRMTAQNTTESYKRYFSSDSKQTPGLPASSMGNSTTGKNSHPCLILGLQRTYILSAMILSFQLMPLVYTDADAVELSLKVSFSYRHYLVLLGSDEFGTCQAKMGHPTLQLSKKAHHQRNKKMKEGAFHHFSGFFFNL